MKRILITTIPFVLLASSIGLAQPALKRIPAQTPPPPPPPTTAGKPGEAPKDVQGFVSQKTGKSFSEANIEDITNENFPDMIESFDYPNADIADVIKAISELTGKNFIIDPGVHGKITIIAPSRITVAEAY